MIEVDTEKRRIKYSKRKLKTIFSSQSLLVKVNAHQKKRNCLKTND